MARKEKSSQKIREAAIREFMHHGYIAATMRGIARSCSLTTGAIYGLYESKEALFVHLVEEDFRAFEEGLLHAMEQSSFTGKESTEEIRRKLYESMHRATQEMLDIYREHQMGIVLALFLSQGSPYGNCKEVLLRRIEDECLKFFEVFVPQPDKIDRLMIHNLVNYYFYSIIDSSRVELSYEETGEFLKHLIDGFIFTWVDLIEKSRQEG